MMKFTFNDLLEKYVKGECSNNEVVKLEQWFTRMRTEKIDGRALNRQDEEQLSCLIESEGAIDEIDLSRFAKSSTSNTILNALWPVTLILIGVVAWIMWREPRTSQLKIHSSANTEKLFLGDGTIVWMKNSKLGYFEKEDSRNIFFQGTALIEVADNLDKLALIQLNQFTMKSSNGDFYVKCNDTEIEIKVLSGMMHISGSEDQKLIQVCAGERITLNDGELRKSTMNESDQEVPYSSEYLMDFQDARLQDVLSKVEKKFNICIHAENEGINGLTLSTDLTGLSLKATLGQLMSSLNVTYCMQDNCITLVQTQAEH